MVCITQLLDINPEIVSRIVENDGVSLLCQKLHNVTSLELIEHVIRALEKIGIENPHSILTARGLEYLAQLFEFLELIQQKGVMKLIKVIIKSIAGNKDLDSFIVPAMGPLANMIKSFSNDEKTKEIIETGMELLLNIYELIPRTHGANDIKLRIWIEKITIDTLINNILNIVSTAVNSSRCDHITIQCWSSMMKILRYICKSSSTLYKRLLSDGLLNNLQELFLINKGKSREGTINEGIILLLDSILPHKHLLTISIKSNNATEYEMECFKKDIIQAQGESIQRLSESIFSQVMSVYKNGGSLSIKIYCLQIIDKILFICRDRKSVV